MNSGVSLPDSRKIAVVSSSSGGLGSEFARQLTAANYRVIGLIRGPQSTPSSPWETIPKIDLQNPETLLTVLPTAMEKLIGSEAKIDMLINCSAILGDGITQPGPERSTSKIDPEFLSKTFQINLFGHIHVTNALLPWLTLPTSPSSIHAPTSKIVNVSARVGSIADNALGGWYSYRMSKAALNMYTKTLAIEVKRKKVCVISIHPGTTDTALSKPFQKNVKADKLFTPEHSVSKMLQVIESCTLEHTGRFYAYDGSSIQY